MTPLVVDASIIGTIVLNEGDGDAAAMLEAQMRAMKVVVPAHSSLEVASILVKAARRQRPSPDARRARLDRVEELLEAAAVQSAATSRTIFDLAMATGLTAYDAVYLELAERLDATLATNDAALIAAGRARGVPILTTRP